MLGYDYLSWSKISSQHDFEVVTPAMCVEYFSAICFLPVVAPLLVLQNCAFSNMLGAFLVRSILFLQNKISQPKLWLR